MNQGDARRLLADLVEERLAEGWMRVEIERELREKEGPGYLLTLDSPDRGRGEVHVVDAAIAGPEGAAYVGELGNLISRWCEHGVPVEDRATPRGELLHVETGLGLLVRHLCAHPGNIVVAKFLLEELELEDVAEAFREAFGEGNRR